MLSLHVLVRCVLLFSCAVLWFVFDVCLVVVECVLFCLIRVCVSFAVYCETLYVWFVGAFVIVFGVCSLFAIYCVMLCGLCMLCVMFGFVCCVLLLIEHV